MGMPASLGFTAQMAVSIRKMEETKLEGTPTPQFNVTQIILKCTLLPCAGADLAKILGIIALGMPASLVFTAQVAVSIRKMVETKLEDTPTPKKLPPFKRFHYSLWGGSFTAYSKAGFQLLTVDKRLAWA